MEIVVKGSLPENEWYNAKCKKCNSVLNFQNKEFQRTEGYCDPRAPYGGTPEVYINCEFCKDRIYESAFKKGKYQQVDFGFEK